MESKKFEVGTPCPDCGGRVVNTGCFIECLDCYKHEPDGSVSIDQLINDEPDTDGGE